MAFLHLQHSTIQVSFCSSLYKILVSIISSNHLIIFPCTVWKCAYFFLLVAPILYYINLFILSVLSVARSTRFYSCFLSKKVELYLTCYLSSSKDYMWFWLLLKLVSILYDPEDGSIG